VNEHLSGIWQRLTGRDFYIWGAGQQGRGIAGTLRRNGLHPAGFLDSSRQLQGEVISGLPILDPETTLAPRPGKEPALVVVASFFFEEEIVGRCLALGLERERDLISYRS